MKWLTEVSPLEEPGWVFSFTPTELWEEWKIGECQSSAITCRIEPKSLL